MLRRKIPEIALLGQPNAGKSTVFNVLSDIKTSVSNFSGTSVDIAHSRIDVHGQTFHLVDLPGVYSLNPGDEAEKVTFAYLADEDIDLMRDIIKKNDAHLSAREEFVIRMRFFDKKSNGRRYVFEDIGNMLGVSRTCVQLTEKRALEKIKAAWQRLTK